MSSYFDTHIKYQLTAENKFRGMQVENAALPDFASSKRLLPQPFWQGHDSAIKCYWKVWELAFRNLRTPTTANGFVANYIDTAFNGNLFMWDSAFILLFARYGSRAFNFQRTLDNLYCKQHDDGFICREIKEVDGNDLFFRFDPASTGPNIMPWAEWEYYLVFGDRERLANVFPVLTAYHQWLRLYRTWQDGSYWTSGWGCGMDNQPRVPFETGYDELQTSWWSHGHFSWVDTCMQQLLSAKTLLQMADALNRGDEVTSLQEEAQLLTAYVNDKMWDDQVAYYFDRFRDGSLGTTKTIGAYWALLADIVPLERQARFIDHLGNPAEFNRPNRVPSLSADHPNYKEDGGYWNGGVWAPTNYMLLRGLSRLGYDSLAHEIAVNNHDNVVKLFEKTDTVWENQSPERVAPGDPAARDFVGWGGLPPTAMMFEYVFGLRPDFEKTTLTWDVRLLDVHGVKQYPYGKDGLLDLHCAKRTSIQERPVIDVKSSIALTLHICWDGGIEDREIKPNV